MKVIAIYPYDFEDPLTGEFSNRFDFQKFSSKKQMLKYLQKNICSDETGKPFNFKTLSEYARLGIFHKKDKDDTKIIKKILN